MGGEEADGGARSGGRREKGKTVMVGGANHAFPNNSQ